MSSKKITLLAGLYGNTLEWYDFILYANEHAKPNRRGLAGSLVMATAFLGILFGAFIFFLLTAIVSHDFLIAWAWRFPFWLSGVLGLIGLYIRLHTHESPKFLAEAHLGEHMPLKRVFLFHRKEVLLSTLFIMLMAVGNYLFIAYIVSFLVKSQGFSIKDATAINLISMLIMISFFPLMGLLSDKIGRKPVFKIGVWGALLLAFPIFWLISQAEFAYVLIGDILLGLLLTPIAGMVPIIIAELFPTRVRNSGTAISYNLALALFGGTAPLVAFKLIEVTHSHLAPAGYLMLSAVVSGLTLYFIYLAMTTSQ